MLNTRQRIIFSLLIILIFICFASYSAGYWFFWAVPTLSTFMWLICDILFLDDDSFLFEPSFAVWQRKSGSSY